MFDGIVTKAVVNELNLILKDAKINKVLMPTKYEIVLDCFKCNTRYFLKISTLPDNCRIHLTKHLKENPKKAYNFCMLLRKHLNGSKITDISTYDLERTVEIEFETKNDLNDIVKKRLFIEIMNRQSNIILTNENYVIIDSIKYFEGKTRSIFPNIKYEYAKIYKISFNDIESFTEFSERVLENVEDTLIKKLPDIFIGFSRCFVENVINILNINNESFNLDDLEKIYDYIKQLLLKIELNEVVLKNVDDSFMIVEGKKKSQDEINYALDDYYFKKEQKDLIVNSKNNLLKITSIYLKRISKKLENINQKLKECDDIDFYKKCGDLLTSSLYKFDKTKNYKEVEVYDYIDDKMTTIKLDESINIGKNIEKFYKKYTKYKNTLEIVGKQKEDTEKEIDYIEGVIFSIENAKDINEINEIYDEISKLNINSKQHVNNIDKSKIEKVSKGKKDSKKIIIDDPVIIDGYKVYIGKNNIQNEYLTLRFSSKADLWFHVQKYHGSHVILKLDGTEDVDESTLYKVATLAKINSKAKDSTNVPVDYCRVKYVKKMPNGKTGMVNYTNFKTIIVK